MHLDSADNENRNLRPVSGHGMAERAGHQQFTGKFEMEQLFLYDNRIDQSFNFRWLVVFFLYP